MSVSGVRAGGAYVEIFAKDGAFQQAMVRVENRLKAAGASMRRFGTNLVLGGAAIGAPLVLAARQAAGFEDALLGMKAAAGLGVGDIARLEEEALKLSRSMGIDPTRIASAFLELTKAGMTVDEVLQGAGRSAVEFAKVSGVEMTDAAVFMKVAMNVFGVSAGQAVDTLSAAADASETSIAAMVESFALVGSAGKTFDQSLFDVSQGLAILARYGIRGEEAGTGIKTMLMRLVSPADSAKEALKQVGLSVSDFRDKDGKLLPIVQIVDVLAQRLQNVDRITRDQVLGDVFGDRGIRVVGAFLDMGVDGFGKMADAMEGNMSVTDKFGVMMSGLSGQFEKLYAAVQRVAISFGKSLGSGLATVVDAIVWTMDAFGMLLEKFPILGSAAAALAAGLVAVGSVAIVAGVALVGLGSVINGVATAALLLASPWAVVSAAVATAVGGMLALAYQLSPAFAGEVDAIMAAIARMDFGAAWEIMSLNFAIALTTMAQKTDETLQWLYGAFASAGSYIGAVLTDGLDMFMGLFGADIISLQSALETLGIYFRAAFDWGFAADGMSQALAQVEAEAQKARAMWPTQESRSEARRQAWMAGAEQRQQVVDADKSGWGGTIDELRKDLERAKARGVSATAQDAKETVKRPELRQPMDAGDVPPGPAKGKKADSGIGQTIGTFAAGEGIGIAPELNKLEDPMKQTAANTGAAANALQAMLNGGVNVADGAIAAAPGLPAEIMPVGGAAIGVNEGIVHAAVNAARGGREAAGEALTFPEMLAVRIDGLVAIMQDVARLNGEGNSILGRIESKLPSLAEGFA